MILFYVILIKNGKVIEKKKLVRKQHISLATNIKTLLTKNIMRGVRINGKSKQGVHEQGSTHWEKCGS